MTRKKRIPQIPVEAVIEALSHEGRGVARVGGKTLFVDGGLPGEKVMVTITGMRSRFDQGDAIEILSPSSDRIRPVCPHFGTCGGCSLQHLSSAAQIRFKEQVLLELLEHFGGVQPETVMPPLAGPNLGYRRSARLGVRFVDKKGKVLVGFRERRTNRIADMDQCPVLDPSVGDLIPELKALVGSLDAFRDIPQIEVAAGDNETALVFRHLSRLGPADLDSLSVFSREHRTRLYLQPGGPDSVHPLSPEDAGHFLHYGLPEFSVDIAFLPLDFIQVNREMNRAMVGRAVRLLDPGPEETVLDLFSGLGNFSIPIAGRAGKVIGIEGDRNMVKRARMNAQGNGRDNTVFLAADLEKGLDPAAWGGTPVHKALIDPPRSGALEVVRHLAPLAPERIVYVSCNPSTLARDAGELIRNGGYRLAMAGIMDMFPHTSHTEAIALFEKT